MNQLSPQDAQFLYMETEDNHIQVTAVALFDPAARLCDLRTSWRTSTAAFT